MTFIIDAGAEPRNEDYGVRGRPAKAREPVSVFMG
jgi:hypothetical protein